MLAITFYVAYSYWNEEQTMKEIELKPRLSMPKTSKEIIFENSTDLENAILELSPELKLYCREEILPWMSECIDAFVSLRDIGGTAGLGPLINPYNRLITGEMCDQIAREYDLAQRIISKVLSK